MASTTVQDPGSQTPKFSRYRSVRKAAAIPEDVPAVPQAQDTASALNRAPSRYHRPNRKHAQTITLPAPPPVDDDPNRLPAHRPLAHSKTVAAKTNPLSRPPRAPETVARPSQPAEDFEFTGGPVQNGQKSGTTSPRQDGHLSRATSKAARSPKAASSPKTYEAAREEARMILEGEYDRTRQTAEQEKRVERRPEPEAPNLKRRVTQVKQQKPQPAYVDAPKLNVKMKVEHSLPKKFHDAPRSIGQTQQQMPAAIAAEDRPDPKVPQAHGPPASRHLVSKKSKVAEDAPVPDVSPQRRFDAPKFDAPISAVNAGDRRVEVRLNQAIRGITLPVTPSTNSRDLLNSASIVMSEDFNPKTSILVESFSKIGLERPLRRYEHIRDVMNSWDADDQNYLTIMTESECQAVGLELNEAPAQPPNSVMVQMHLSLRPGKWDKRWVILRSDGQVTMSKHENDGEGANICHLSDFDVYTPTTTQRKKLKPPKKICFAIKSQQKSAMFLEGVNFVHFFATSDKQIADRWYTAVQAWRSWYLVHVLGEGAQKAQKAKEAATAGGLLGGTDARPCTAQSADSVPYQLGSFQPLLDFSEIDFSSFTNSDTISDAKAKENHRTKKPSVDLAWNRPSLDLGVNEATIRGSRQRNAPPSSYPAKLLSDIDARGRPSLENSDQGFTGRGLLGRSLSTRRSQGGRSGGQSVPGVPGKPLVDLTPMSDFAEGSLLRKLEAFSATQGENELKIDRQKRVEADVRVGEGLG